MASLFILYIGFVTVFGPANAQEWKTRSLEILTLKKLKQDR